MKEPMDDWEALRDVIRSSRPLTPAEIAIVERGPRPRRPTSVNPVVRRYLISLLALLGIAGCLKVAGAA